MELNGEWGTGYLPTEKGMEESLIITRSALERLEKDYATRAEKSDKLGADSMAMYLYGKADLLTSLRQLIEPNADIL